MKNLLTVIALFISFQSQAQYKNIDELPSDLLENPVLLTTSLDEDNFEAMSEQMIADLKILGINVVYKMNLSKNPSKFAKQREEMEQLLVDYKISNIVGVNFLTFKFHFKQKSFDNIQWKREVEKEKAYITVMDAEQVNSKQPEIFMIDKNTYNKVLDKFKKTIDTQFTNE